ncbi:MAG: signal peptidase I [Bdellovibrionaceae bacterium]|nr:signal peptidase I [Pseudobdellovibrionaceae bacterium]
MHGLLEPGEKVVVEFGTYSCTEPQREDLVVLQRRSIRGGSPAAISVKRLAGLPGDQILVMAIGNKSILYINNEVVANPAGRPLLLSPASAEMFRQVELAWQGRIPKDRYLVFGTKSVGSVDSTEWGPLAREELVGRVINSPR